MRYPLQIRQNNGVFSLNDLIAAAKAQAEGQSAPPVDQWNPEFCGDMDLTIKSDGTWWHEGTPFVRESLVRLFATILRRDDDGHHYLVTPYEKIRIKVERAAFSAQRVDVKGSGQDQDMFFTTNVGEVIKLSPDRPLRVDTDPVTLEPSPYLSVRGRLEALLTRACFYELVEHAVERSMDEGVVLGVWSGGAFFPLGPADIHKA